MASTAGSSVGGGGTGGGGASGAASAAGSNANASKGGSRFHSPPVELPSSNAQNFFEEAKITKAEENELRRKFGKFCTRAALKDGGDEEAFLTLDNFCRMLQYYECASAQHYEAYFHAIDRNKDDRLDFQEFFLGCCAADPATVHILNSFTGYERSQYIFDFYDTNRTNTLEFDEFARLTADCLSLQSTDPNDEQVKHQAIDKARDLGALQETDPGMIHFTCIKFKKFYEFIQNERLRGTSRLFRFYKSIIKSRAGHHSRRAQNANASTEAGGTASTTTGGAGGGGGTTGSNTGGGAGSSIHGARSAGGGSGTGAGTGAGAGSGGGPNAGSTGPSSAVGTSTAASATTTAGASATASAYGGTGNAATGEDNAIASAAAAADEDQSDREDLEWHAHLLDLDAQFDPDAEELPCPGMGAEAWRERGAAPPYVSLLPPAPASALRPEPEPPSWADARATARKVLRTLCARHYDGLLAPGATIADADAQFLLASPAQLRSLCAAAVRHLESEDMLLTGLQAPVKIFGALHGQVLDLLSHFKWHQNPTEEGDILYTTYVFLGDYADRGAYGLEVLTLLLSLKVAHPHRVALLRGHHENRHLNFHLGLKQECDRRLGPTEGPRIFEHLNRVFEHMSLAAVISGQILALGPGVMAPSLTRLEQIRRYKKPLVLPHASQPKPAQQLDRQGEQLLLELFTPSPLMPWEMGTAREMPPEQVQAFCSQHKLAAVVRSRPVPSKGFGFECGGRLVSITSCVNYCDLPHGNDAAILCIAKDESSQHLQIRPKVLTAQVGKVYKLIGRAHRSDGSLRQHRWPAQVRDATPGRCVGRAAGEEQPEPTSESAALVLLPDRSVASVPDVSLDPFPAFGHGRPPGGVVPRGRDDANEPTGMLSLGHAAGLASSMGTAPEEWSLLTNTGGRPGMSDRRGLGPRRGSAANKDSKRGYGLGKVFADPIVMSSPHSGASGPEGAHRRSGPSPGTDGPRLSLGASGALSPTSVGSAASPAGGTGRIPDKSHSAGTATPTGRSTPASGGMPSGQHERRGSSGKGRDPPTQARGPSRPPAAAAPSPKAASAVAGGQRVQARRAGSEASAARSESGASTAAAAAAASPSPRQARRGSEDGEASRGNSAEDVLADPSVGVLDHRALSHMLQSSARKFFAPALPTSPVTFLQLPRAAEQPLPHYLCRIWVEAGFTDKEWTQAIHIFEFELGEQARQAQGRVDGASPGGGSGGNERDGRWTIEIFSMWLLKRGKRLREIPNWFRAFDFDQDDMISISDFIQGLVACDAPRLSGPNTAGGLCTALLLYRLLDLEKNQDGRELEGLLAEAQATDFDFFKATDFDFFRVSLLPQLQGAAPFRLRIFGPTDA